MTDTATQRYDELLSAPVNYAVEIRITLGSDKAKAEKDAEHLNDLLHTIFRENPEIEVIQSEIYTY